MGEREGEVEGEGEAEDATLLVPPCFEGVWDWVELGLGDLDDRGVPDTDWEPDVDFVTSGLLERVAWTLGVVVPVGDFEME
jgi:hypothetical protein